MLDNELETTKIIIETTQRSWEVAEIKYSSQVKTTRELQASFDLVIGKQDELKR